jgi:hypothetical protein
MHVEAFQRRSDMRPSPAQAVASSREAGILANGKRLNIRGFGEPAMPCRSFSAAHFRDRLTGKLRSKRILTARVLKAKALLRLNASAGAATRRKKEDSHELFTDRGIGRHLHPAVSGLRGGQADRHHRGDQPAEIARHG